jgi:hypothetical protein
VKAFVEAVIEVDEITPALEMGMLSVVVDIAVDFTSQGIGCDFAREVILGIGVMHNPIAYLEARRGIFVLIHKIESGLLNPLAVSI